MEIRRFRDEDAEALSALIALTLRTTNRRDYSSDYLEALIKTLRPQDIRTRAANMHIYVACQDGVPVGCGAIGPAHGRGDESCLYNIFVLPAWQGQGVGRRIVETLERDPLFLHAARTEVPASITAAEFYLRLGYRYCEGGRQPDGQGLLRLEKTRQAAGEDKK